MTNQDLEAVAKEAVVVGVADTTLIRCDYCHRLRKPEHIKYSSTGRPYCNDQNPDCNWMATED